MNILPIFVNRRIIKSQTMKLRTLAAALLLWTAGAAAQNPYIAPLGAYDGASNRRPSRARCWPST